MAFKVPSNKKIPGLSTAIYNNLSNEDEVELISIEDKRR